MGRHKLAQLEAPCRQLGDAIGANPIDADVTQGFPLLHVVGSPCDYSPANRMDALDQLLVDERRFLPKIFGARCHERSSRIDVTRDLQHTGSDRGEYRFYRFDDTVVESVDRAIGTRLTYAPHDKRLDVSRLDLDVNFGAIPDGVENRVKRRNLDPVPERKPAQIRGREVDNFSARRSGRVHLGIVVYDHDPVARGVDIELDRVRSQVDRSEECGNRVLRQRLVGTTVRYLFGLHTLHSGGEGFLEVVALGTMSAKHMSAVRRGQSALTAGLRERLPDEAP